MRKIQITPEMLAKLHEISFQAQLCDESGEVKGVVLPVELYEDMFDVWADADSDPAALERARNEPGGMTTAEAVAYVRKLAAE